MGLVETFENAAGSLRHEEEFRDVEIVAHRAQRSGGAMALSLIIDKPGGVDLAICGRIAARLDASLDAENEPYTLEVASAGLDRPLLAPSDYERFKDRNVLVKTRIAIKNEYTHRGKLVGLRGNAVILDSSVGELPIPLELVKAANVEYDPRADLRRAKKEKREKR